MRKRMNKIAAFQKRQMKAALLARGLNRTSSTSVHSSILVGRNHGQDDGRRLSLLLSTSNNKNNCNTFRTRTNWSSDRFPYNGSGRVLISNPSPPPLSSGLLVSSTSMKHYCWNTRVPPNNSFFHSAISSSNLPLVLCGLTTLVAAFEFTDKCQSENAAVKWSRDPSQHVKTNEPVFFFSKLQQLQDVESQYYSKQYHSTKCLCEADLSMKVDPTPLNSSRTIQDHSQNSNYNHASDDHDNPTTTNSDVNPENFKHNRYTQPRNVMLHRHRSTSSRSLSDKYKVDWKTVLGEGAYGSVHPARLASTGEKVALKKIAKRYTDTSSFCRETNALLRIYNNGGHPNISGLRDMYEDNDHYYLVMDLVSGGEMFDHLIHYGAYSEADAARLMREVASALAFLHGVGVVHADLKPENLLLCSKKRVDGTIKMIDFGCAIVEKEEEEGEDDGYDEESNKAVLQSSSGKDTHQTIQSWIEILNRKSQQSDHSLPSEQFSEFTGTTAYWPPERFSSSRPPDHAADMWAVGVILYIMLTGVHPFDLTGVATDAEIAEQIKKDPSPPITKGLTSHLSPSAIELIQLLMDKNPKRRLTADQMLQHPWIAGDEATTEIMQDSAEKLEKFRNLRHIIEAGIFSILIEKGSKDMVMSEYTPKMVYKDDQKGGVGKQQAPASSVLKKAFEAFDEGGKGFISADDLSRVVTETTGQKLSDIEKNEMIGPYNEDAAGSLGLSLSSFSKIAAGLKHKHYPRGHIVFRAGDIGDAMYFINSGKVEIQTKKGQLIHILRHGDFFGEGSLLEAGDRRFSTAKCATPVDLIKIKRSDFERYIENSKSAKETLMFRWKARTLADAKAFIRLQTNLKSVELNKGDVVYREGDMGKSMYFVDEERGGELEVKHGDVIVHKYGQGESFGESSLLLEKPRSSTVTCISDKCLLHEMMGVDFLAFLETSPDTKAALLNMCRKRLFKKAVKKYSLEHNRGFTNEDLMKAFELADTNKCGILDYDDVKKLMHAMDPSIPESEIIELMKFIDVDMDGKLSFREFKRLFRSFEFQL